MQEIGHILQAFAAVLPPGKIQVKGCQSLQGSVHTDQAPDTAQIFP